jgi:hypothetical protein
MNKFRMKPLLGFLIWMPLAGCGSISPESVYEGIRSQQKINTDPAMPNPLLLPPYDQFKKERESSRQSD